ncbi:hypothetical protein [Terasakiella sp. SH-1]|uniref:hypothetical protein n=1 Tax=Terasakiella sp. SH-1 TaxID=2560057 RepID=UPI0010730C55|nr:hypothetical protein [Terasakiella sp. SH-1]
MPLDQSTNKQSARVWSERLNDWIEISNIQAKEAVDELLLTGVGTRMLVPDWDTPNTVKD